MLRNGGMGLGHYRRYYVSAALLLVAAPVPGARAAPPSTYAPIFVPSPNAINVMSPIPGNGGIVIASSSGQPMVRLAPSAEPAMPIAGHVEQLSPHWIWQADTPLAPGAYQLQLTPMLTASNQSTSPMFFAVTVSESWQPAVPELTSMAEARAVETAIETACCRHLLSGELIAGPFCPAIRASYHVHVSLPLSATTATDTELNQFLYRARAAGAGPDEAPAFFPSWTLSAEFREQAEEYCFTVDAIDIATQEIHLDVPLEPRCVTHGDLPDLAAHDVAIDDAELMHTTCAAPPVGSEGRWCELNETECAAEPVTCRFYGHVCRGEPLPQPPMVVAGADGASGAAGAGGMLAGGAGGAGGASGMTWIDNYGRNPGTRSASACAISRGESSSAGVLLTLLAIGSAWLTRRAKRRGCDSPGARAGRR